MSDAPIRERLNVIFRDIFDDDTITVRDDMTANDVERWDSVTHIDLIAAVENAFKVKFTTREVQRLATVGELIKLIAQKMPK